MTVPGVKETFSFHPNTTGRYDFIFTTVNIRQGRQIHFDILHGSDKSHFGISFFFIFILLKYIKIYICIISYLRTS